MDGVVVADYDLGRAERLVERVGDPRSCGAGRRIERAAIAALVAEHRCDVVMNAADPRFVMPQFRAALSHGAHYLDMAMSLSHPHPDALTRRPG